jgi:chaperone modulatory protein CbpM
MEKELLIPANDLCIYYEVSYTFISSLHDAGLINLIVIEDIGYLHRDSLKDLERLIHLHNELDINMGGLETIFHLLEKIKTLEQKLHTIEQRLSIYE